MYTSDNKEDKVLFSRADDLVDLAYTRNKPCFMGFLNEREAYLLKEYLSNSGKIITFYGGYENAERTVLCCSEFVIDDSDFPVKAIYFKFRKSDVLSHRDFLGSLMALGVDRSCIGDILVGTGCAVCYVKNEIYEYIVSQVSKIGRVGVSFVNYIDFSFNKNIEETEYIVSSLRLDVVIAAICKMSRAKTNEYILSGKVFVNYLENNNFSHTLRVGDILTLRGFGKFIIKGSIGVTKKGRIKIIIEHYR